MYRRASTYSLPLFTADWVNRMDIASLAIGVVIGIAIGCLITYLLYRGATKGNREAFAHEFSAILSRQLEEAD